MDHLEVHVLPHVELGAAAELHDLPVDGTGADDRPGQIQAPLNGDDGLAGLTESARRTLAMSASPTAAPSP